MADQAPAVSDEPITLSETTVDAPRRSDVKQMTVEQQYVPRLDGTEDETARADQRLAMAVAQVLVKHFYGYTWHVMAESRQGVITFAIPELMGPTLKCIIKLGEFPANPEKTIVRIAGELLERMGLRRGPMDVAEYEHAKNNMHQFQFGDVKQ